MKVIDLLNKIANGEEVPKKIKYKNYIYWYDKDWKDYKNAQVEYSSYLISVRYHTTDFLNEKVEIIEDTPKEDKKIKKLEIYDNSIEWCCNGRAITDTEKDIIDKTNELIDKINDKDAPKKIEQIKKSYDIMIYSPEDDTYNYDLNKLIDMVQDIYNKQSEIIDRLNGEENEL